MCANTQALFDKAGNKCLVMSDRAYRSYSKENLEQLKQNLKLIVTKVDTIECVGGGSCRCMTSEEYTPLIVEEESSCDSSPEFNNRVRGSVFTAMSSSELAELGKRKHFSSNQRPDIESTQKRARVDDI